MNTISLALALTLLSAGAAAAQTSPCQGEAPAAGVEVQGPVLHVLDGTTLCVATGAAPTQWIPVTLDDAPPAAEWGALMGVAFGKDVTCTMAGAGRATCRVADRSIAAQLRDPAATKAGVTWRRPADPAAPTPARVPMRMAAAGA